MTIDRQTVRDIGLAVLLALPTAALTRPAAPDSSPERMAAAPHVAFALADRSAPQRFTLAG